MLHPKFWPEITGSSASSAKGSGGRLKMRRWLLQSPLILLQLWVAALPAIASYEARQLISCVRLLLFALKR
jgi:hypothetical protein